MHSSFNHNPPADAPESYWQAASSARARRSTALPARADVAVIGGGLLGAATAYWLSRAGVAKQPNSLVNRNKRTKETKLLTSLCTLYRIKQSCYNAPTILMQAVDDWPIAIR